MQRNEQQDEGNNNADGQQQQHDVGVLYGFYLKLNSGLEDAMAKTGTLSANYPFVILAVIVTVMATLCVGLSMVTFETDVYELWIERGSRLRNERAFVKKQFGDQRSRVNFLLATSKNGGKNVMYGEALAEWLSLNKIVTQSVQVTVNGVDYKWNDVCDRIPNPFLDLPCSKFTVIDCFKEGDFDFFLPRGVPGVPPNLFEYKPSMANMTSGQLLEVTNGSCRDWANIKTPENFIMGGVVRDDSRNMASVASFQSIFRTSGFNAFAKRMFSTNTPSDDQEAKAKEVILAWEKQYIEKMLEQQPSELTLSYFASRSDDDLMAEVSRGDALLLVVGYLGMLAFVGFSLTNRIQHESKVVVGVCGVLLVSLSIFASLGFLAMTGLTFNFMHFQVLPFLALGLGVDDLFVLAFTYTTKSQAAIESSVSTITQESLREAGSSITLTSSVNLLAFGLGALMPLPAMSVFSLSVAVTVIFNYIAITFGFASMLVLNQRFVLSATNDAQQDENQTTDDNGDTTIIAKASKAIVSPIGGVMMAAITIVLITMASIGINRSEVGLPLSQIVPKEHYSRRFLTTRDEYYTALEASIVIGMTKDGSDDIIPYETNLGSIMKLESDFEKEVPHVYKEIPIRAVSWVDNFVLWVHTNHPTEISSTHVMVTSAFYSRLNQWLTTTTKGLAMRSGVKFDAQGTVVAASIKYYQSLSSNAQYRQHITDSRYVTDHNSLPAFPEGLAFNFYEQYLRVKDYLVTNMLLAGGGIMIAGFLFLFHPIAVVLMTSVIVLTAIEAYGCMYWFNLKVNGVSVINVVMGMGMSVEFTAHILRSYMTKSGTNLNRARGALEAMMSPVMLGGFSTLIGVFPLLFSMFPYYKLYFFFQYLLLICIGMLNGIVLLPLILSVVGPPVLVSTQSTTTKDNNIDESITTTDVELGTVKMSMHDTADTSPKELPTFPSSRSGAVHIPTSISGRLAITSRVAIEDNDGSEDNTTITPMPSTAA